MPPQKVHDKYQWLYTTPAGKQWERIGAQRRAGVAVPLFSLYSRQSIGIGDLMNIPLLVDWCRETGLSIIQLLPLNDTGFNFTPYAAQSTFALEPMYLSLEKLCELDTAAFAPQLHDMRMQFPAGQQRVDYQIKAAKLKILQNMFKSKSWEKSKRFQEFQSKNDFWLDDYALFKVIKNNQQEKAWWEWPEDLKKLTPKLLAAFRQRYKEALTFQKWLQWQLYEQFIVVQSYAQSKNVWLMGDLPFLVSKDSADVWARQHYFKLHLSAGAPPDIYYADGQRWGMPPYNWDAIAANNYDYLINKLQYAENFYDLFRIDHFVGIFRIWTIPVLESANHTGTQGVFDPAEEADWEKHGRKLLDVMLANTRMLPCAEDLGTVPDCSYKVIREYGLVGTDVQRWQRHWGKSYDFKGDEEFRLNAIATGSTHDTMDLRGWWEYEIGTIDEMVFRHKCLNRGLDSDWLIDQLFDTEKSVEGRLRWKTEIRSLDQFLSYLKRSPEQVGDFISLFHETINEREKFWHHIGMSGEVYDHFSPALAEKTLEKINKTVSIFSIQLLQDWLATGEVFSNTDAREYRINRPGTVSDKNWSIVLPLSLEALLKLEVNQTIRDIIKRTARI